jgi:DNA-binding NarL/FixJ family response regulator
MDNINLLIVDDHPMMREALLTALEDEPDLHVVAEAANGLEALTLAAQYQPDVILMDLLLPDMGGLEAISHLQEKQPGIKVMVISSLEDEKHILTAVQSGALGYFPKSASRDYLLDAIRQVADGVPYLPPNIAQKLFKRLREMKQPLPVEQPSEPITQRQTEILSLLGKGGSDAEIAACLHISEATVRTHIHHILQRLNLPTRAQAIVYAEHQHKPDA